MTARALEELDRGLGSCLASEDLSELVKPCPGQLQEDKAQVIPRLAETSRWPQGPEEPQAAGGVDARPQKMEKEPVTRPTLNPGKEKLKSGATPRSAPARKKVQAAPPVQPPPPPPALSEELPWGDMTLNKCLVLASLVALLGSAFQLCRDAVAGEEATPAPWVPPISPRKDQVSPMPKPEAWTPPSKPPVPQVGPPAPQVVAEDKPEVPRSPEAAEKVQRDPAEATGEAPGEEHTTLTKQRPKEKPRREKMRKAEKPWKEKLPKEERPWQDRPRREERSQAARELWDALPRRWETRKGAHQLWARNSRDPEHRKGQAWASPRRPDEDRRRGRQKHRQGKGRD